MNLFRRTALLALFAAASPAVAQDVVRGSQAKIQFGYAAVENSAYKQGIWMVGGSWRKAITRHISLEPEFTYTGGGATVFGRKWNTPTSNGTMKLVVDRKGTRAVPYLTAGVGVSRSGNDLVPIAIVGGGWRIGLSRRVSVIPELRLSTPVFGGTTVFGIVGGLGYSF